MTDLKPWPLLMIVGGLVVAGSTFLDWNSLFIDGTAFPLTGWDMGLLGLYQTLIGLAVAFMGVAQMGPRTFPNPIATLTLNQWMLALSVAVVVWGFGLQFDNNPEIGIFTTWLGGVVAAVGSLMTERTRTEA